MRLALNGTTVFRYYSHPHPVNSPPAHLIVQGLAEVSCPVADEAMNRHLRDAVTANVVGGKQAFPTDSRLRRSPAKTTPRPDFLISKILAYDGVEKTHVLVSPYGDSAGSVCPDIIASQNRRYSPNLQMRSQS
jgi:hypothetical protein